MSSASGSRDADPVFSMELKGSEVTVGPGRAQEKHRSPGLQVRIDVCQGYVGGGV